MLHVLLTNCTLNKFSHIGRDAKEPPDAPPRSWVLRSLALISRFTGAPRLFSLGTGIEAIDSLRFAAC